MFGLYLITLSTAKHTMNTSTSLYVVALQIGYVILLYQLESFCQDEIKIFLNLCSSKSSCPGVSNMLNDTTY